MVISTEGERVSENSLEEREGFTQVGHDEVGADDDDAVVDDDDDDVHLDPGSVSDHIVTG